MPGMPQPPQPPAHLAKMFVEKPGFTNYHFNELERDRTLKGLAAWGDYSQESGNWTLAAVLSADQSPCEFTLGDAVAGLVIGAGKKAFVQELTPDAKLEDEPPQSGGLLLAMHHLRRLLLLGPSGFSEFYYLGSEPLDGTGESVDVIFCERYGARTHWYFSRATGLLIGFDTFRDEEVDPCEVRLEGHVELGNRRLPESWSIRSGEFEFARLKFTSARFGPPTAPSGKSATNSEAKSDGTD
jgi:hypothetical protein